jgi:hypothetical protein
VEGSVTEESRNNRLNNRSLLFMGTSRENPAPKASCLVGCPRIAHTANQIPQPGIPDFLQIRMDKAFSSTNFVHWINGVESDFKGQQAGPDPDARPQKDSGLQALAKTVSGRQKRFMVILDL